MSEFIQNLLTASFHGSIVILAVILLRLLLRKTPKKYICLLWLLAGIRLLMPIAIRSELSLQPEFTLPGWNLPALLPWVWSAVAVCFGVYSLVSYLKLKAKVQEAVRIRGGWECDKIETAFILGFIKPRIYIPMGMNRQARKHILAHERTHLDKGDHWIKMIGFLALALHWFNPLVWIAYILLCKDIEMACDERVVKGLTLSDKKAYSASLLRCSVKARYVTACPLAFGEGGVKERIKSVLNYKKPAFWVIAVTLIVTLVLGVGLLTSPVERVSEIRCNGCLYVLFNSDYSFLPAEDPVGTLRSILHNTDEHPTEEFQGTNLDESLAGCPLYLEGDQLYLLKYDGSCMAFRLLTPHAFLSEALRKDPTCLVNTKAEHTEGWEGLIGAQNEALLQLLEAMTSTTEFTPFSGPWSPDYVLCMEFFSDDGLTVLFRLRLYSDGAWLLDSLEPDISPKGWTFQSDALTQWAEPYLLRADAHDTLFDDQIYSITYHTAESNGVSMTVGTPQGWYAETALFDRGTVLRCKPASSEQWMEITYYDHNDTLYYTRFEYESITLANGAAGTLCHRGNPAHWQLLALDTVQGQLHITSPATEHEWDWTDEDFRTALTILSTLTVTENGTSLLGQPNHMGLTLSVSDVTPHGLTLICAQDGTPAAEVWKDSQWWVEQLVDGKWVQVFPGDETAWTTEAYLIPIGGTRDFHVSWTNFVPSLNPGTYRIAKSFYANLTPVTILSPDPETVTQIYYAEFTIK